MGRTRFGHGGGGATGRNRPAATVPTRMGPGTRRALGAISLVLLVSACTGDDGDGGQDRRPGTTSTTAAATTTAVADEQVAEQASAYRSALRERINDTLGFATAIQALHADVVAGRVDGPAVRERGGGFVAQVTRTVEALDALPAPEVVAPSPAIARLAVRGYLLGARTVAEVPDGAVADAVSSALRLKLLSDSTFDRARILLSLQAGGLSDRDQTILAAPVPDFAAAGVEPPAAPDPAPGPRTFEQAAASAAGAADDLAAILASGDRGADAERTLRTIAATLEADVGPGGAPEQHLTALQLASLLAAESAVLSRAGLGAIAADTVTLARELWNTVAPLLEVAPIP